MMTMMEHAYIKEEGRCETRRFMGREKVEKMTCTKAPRQEKFGGCEAL